jgi:hypothetical protein
VTARGGQSEQGESMAKKATQKLKKGKKVRATKTLSVGMKFV